MTFDAALASRVESYFSRRSVRYETKQMMGGLVFMVNDKMCTGVENDRLMLRIDPTDVPAALKRPGCHPMDFTGRPMRSFVFVERRGVATPEALREWLNLALAFNPRAKRSGRAATAKKRG